jgi:hypothetical protein
VPSFSSRFYLPYPGGTKRAVQEKPVIDKQKRLRQEKARKQMESQKRGAKSSDTDEEEDDDDSKEDDEDLVALRSVPDALLGSSSSPDLMVPMARRVPGPRSVLSRSRWLHCY